MRWPCLLFAPLYVLSGIVHGGVTGAVRGAMTGLAALRLDCERRKP